MSNAGHYRRCHVCGHVTADEREVHECNHCGKELAPFYFFDETDTAIYTDDRQRPQIADGKFEPVHGLTVEW